MKTAKAALVFALCLAALAAQAEGRKTLNDRAAAHIAAGTAPAAVRSMLGTSTGGARAAAAARTWHVVHSGDSGHPLYLDLGDRLVLCSFCTSAGHGPDLTHPTTIRILQAVAASVGDTLKVWEGD